MISCVDASVALKWVFEEERSDAARALLEAATDGTDRLIAPALLRFEVTNAIHQQARGGLPAEEAEEKLTMALAAPVTYVGLDAIHPRALAISRILDLGAAYDAHYVALAELVGCDLWTDDRRLVRAAGSGRPFVRWLGDYR